MFSPRAFLCLSVTAFALVAAAAHAGPRPRSVTVQPMTARAAAGHDFKMDAALRLVVGRAPAEAAGGSVPDQASGPRSLYDPAAPFRLFPAAGGGEPEAFVFVRLDGEDAVHALTEQGARVVVQRGDLVLARMPVSSIVGAAASPRVLSMSLSKRWESTIDSSRIRTRVLDVHQGSGGLPQAYQGTDVIVGVLDSGIDYTHDDFRVAANDSRLVGLLDFSQGTNGAECRVGQLDSLTCPEIDGTGGFGHGTHVTGIAAGNGRRNAAYVGMAPKADLLFVKGIRDAQSNGGFTDADVVNGCAWMLDRAFALGRPIAINLSLGSQFGAHDGTSLQEQFLDRFAGPGRIIVCAAGNSGGSSIHVSYAAQGTEFATALESGYAVPSSGGVVDLWAPATTNLSVGIAVYDPTDLTTPLFVSEAASPGQLRQGTATFNTTALGNVSIDARTTADPNNGARNVLIQITPAAGGIDPATVVWSIYTFGTGTFDMWANAGSIFMPPSIPAPAWFRAGDDARTVGVPATAKRVICVGSHVSKTQWIDIDDFVRVQPNATLDAISRFSSRGPSRDGRVLPNITAPGEAIISALSSGFPADRPHIVQGGGYQEQQGTSQAAPHVTGIAALMLQRDPALTPENVRAILQQTATPAGGAVPNNVFGSGRVQALAALQATPDPLQCVTPLPNGVLVPCDQLAGQPAALMAYPNPSPGRLRLSFLTPARGRVHLALYDCMGRRVRTLIDGDVAAGVQSPVWAGDDDDGRLLPSGIYFAKLITPSASRSIRLLLTR